MSTEHVLRIEGVTQRFGGLVAVRDVNLALRSHTITGLIGPNGAGKTTLINLLTGVLKPTSGSVFLDGAEITRLAPHRRVRRGMVGHSPQQTGQEENRAAAKRMLGHFHLVGSGVWLPRELLPPKSGRPSDLGNRSSR